MLGAFGIPVAVDVLGVCMYAWQRVRGAVFGHWSMVLRQIFRVGMTSSFWVRVNVRC